MEMEGNNVEDKKEMVIKVKGRIRNSEDIARGSFKLEIWE